MKYLVLFLLALSTTNVSQASEVSYIRDYTYKASDLDSKVSARNNTLKLIKAGVLDEIVSYVYSNSNLEQAQSGNNFKTSFIQRTSSSSAGFVKARILEENWDGFEMRIKAEVKADPEKIRKELERSLEKKPSPPQPAVEQIPTHPQPDMSGYHAAMVPVSNTTADYSGYMRAAQLTEVYALLMPIKISMTEYYMMTGEWPSSLKDIRLKPEEMNDGRYLEKVRLGKDGQIYAFLSNTFGKNKLLSLKPRSIMGGTQTRWECFTNVNTKGMPTMSNNLCSEDSNLKYN